MDFTPGALLWYHNRSARLVALNGDKLELVLEGGAAARVRPKDVTLLHPGPVTELPTTTPPLNDRAELAELIGGETIPFREFCALLTGVDTPGAAWAGFAELRDDLYFTGSVAEGVRARPAAEVEAQLAARAARQAAREAREALIERLKRGVYDPERDRAALGEIEQVARGQLPASRLLKELGLPGTPGEAHRLLLRLGAWDEWEDPLPARSGVELTELELPLPRLRAEERWDLTGLAAYAIDDEDSDDPDDAVSWDGELIYIHVADVSALVRPDTELDLAAMRRGRTLYLPERIVPMLPGGAVPLLGLGLQEESPAFTFALRVTAEGELELVRFGPSRVRVQRLTYAGAELRLAEEPFAALNRVLEPWRARRRANGGIELDFPELKLRVRERELEVTPIRRSAARRLVEDLMVAAGSAVGNWARQRELPLPFAVQSLGERDPQWPATSWPEMFRIRTASAPAVLSASPDWHRGLGVPAYVRVTSPLRRYPDLLAHQQLRRVLSGEEPLTADELESRFVWCEEAARTRIQLERAVNNYWTLVYLKQQPPERRYRAVLLGSVADKQVLLLPEPAYFYRTRFGAELAPGTELEAECTRIDLADQTAAFRLQTCKKGEES